MGSYQLTKDDPIATIAVVLEKHDAKLEEHSKWIERHDEAEEERAKSNRTFNSSLKVATFTIVCSTLVNLIVSLLMLRR